METEVSGLPAEPARSGANSIFFPNLLNPCFLTADVRRRRQGGAEKIFIKKVLVSCIVIEEIQFLRGDGKFDGTSNFRYFLKKRPRA
jgi:hypothetical protein